MRNKSYFLKMPIYILNFDKHKYASVFVEMGTSHGSICK
jgi:hypothetical protein